MENINKTKRGLFEKIKNINKSLVRHTKKKRETTQINKIRNQREVTTDTIEKQTKNPKKIL